MMIGSTDPGINVFDLRLFTNESMCFLVTGEYLRGTSFFGPVELSLLVELLVGFMKRFDSSEMDGRFLASLGIVNRGLCFSGVSETMLLDLTSTGTTLTALLGVLVLERAELPLARRDLEAEFSYSRSYTDGEPSETEGRFFFDFGGD